MEFDVWDISDEQAVLSTKSLSTADEKLAAKGQMGTLYRCHCMETLTHDGPMTVRL